MCGRYYRRSDGRRIAETFGVVCPPSFDISPSYNIAPQTFQPVVRLSEDTFERKLVLMRWGFIPHWARDARIGHDTINAKCEKVTTGAMFRDAIRYGRCLIPADGFFQWQENAGKVKQPFAISLKDGSLFAFAGLWERWTDKTTNRPQDTYAILTTEPNDLIASIHDRMPAILAAKDYERWMAPADPAHLPVDLLRPYPAEEMITWKIDVRVGDVTNDEATLIGPR
jgi:putative SOS response-associated peptidase YedK